MKKYETPKADVNFIAAIDVITVSVVPDVINYTEGELGMGDNFGLWQ